MTWASVFLNVVLRNDLNKRGFLDLDAEVTKSQVKLTGVLGFTGPKENAGPSYEPSVLHACCTTTRCNRRSGMTE